MIPFANFQPELACPVNNHTCNIHDLVLRVQSSGDVGELKKFFDSREYGHDRFPRILDHLLDDVFALKELVGNKLTVVVLEVSQHVRHGVVD